MTIAMSMLETIGNTPVVQLRSVVPPDAATVLVKLEYVNPTGSYKDRAARSMIEEAERRGDLRPGMTVVEYTGGSTGSSLAFVCAMKGYRLRIVTSDAFAAEKRRTMEAFGAELIIEPSDGGQITPDLIPRMMARAKQIVEDEGAYPTDQFRNPDNAAGYRDVARELVAQAEIPIDVFVAGFGTAGFLTGMRAGFREAGVSPRIVALEVASSAIVSTGVKGAHHVEGIGVGFVPPMLGPETFDRIETVDEADARAMARRLAREEGIFAGTSSGLNVVGAIRIAQELGPGHVVATAAVDSGLKYLSGDLFG
jgi:cysteine synthase A